PSGKHIITVYAPAHVIEGDPTSSVYGRTLEVTEEEAIENVDFSLIRGGVITGKLTDANNKPVIDERVFAFRLDQNGKHIGSNSYVMSWMTDDRGIYRIFGLDPGRYVVGAGSAGHGVNRDSKYKRTYHPEAPDEAKATIIEVKAGGEVENINIKLARASKTYAASGRVVDAETSNPIPGVNIQYSVLQKGVGNISGIGHTVSNSNGEFRIEGLQPNTYSIFDYNPGQRDSYADPVDFEIVNSDVSGLELKMVRGASISGVAVIEGVRDPAILAQLSKIQLQAGDHTQDISIIMLRMMSGGGVGKINPDGSFRINGLRPGKAIISASHPDSKNFTLARVERNGIEVSGLDVAQGEQITGIRLVFKYGNGVVAGRVEIKGGTLPPNSQMFVRLVPEGASPQEYWRTKSSPIDTRGSFSIDGLAQGNYKAQLMVLTPGEDVYKILPKAEQAVAVTGDIRQEITLVLDLTKKEAANDSERVGN
ncbi:MAG TPA: carboxypeptidase regulatory-like domain-containing protein, partial [Blastocatellia bacterium]|nr:carboxypeptidase regulatory-like domain-containing protein [Blastocatellia bacterium]